MTQVQCAASPLGRFDLVMMGEHLKVEKITHDILPLDKKPNSEDKLLWAGMKRIKISK